MPKDQMHKFVQAKQKESVQKKHPKLEHALTFKVGEPVPESGYYVCVPCGYKKYYKKGESFTSCMGCMAELPEEFAPGLELWEKVEGR